MCTEGIHQAHETVYCRKPQVHFLKQSFKNDEPPTLGQHDSKQVFLQENSSLAKPQGLGVLQKCTSLHKNQPRDCLLACTGTNQNPLD